MGKRFFLLGMLLWLSGPALLVLGGCRAKNTERMEGGEEEPSLLRLSAGMVQVAGLKTIRAEYRNLPLLVRATATISLNRRQYVRLSSRVAGRIEEIYAFEGDRVMAGDRLAALYSDEFLAAQQEFIQLCLRHTRALEAGEEEAVALSARLIQSAAQKLKLMGVTEEEVGNLKETQNLNPYLFLRAPLSGSVIVSRATAGAYVERGTELFEVADLGLLWAEVDIFEKDLAMVRPGCEAEVRVQAYPEETFPGRLTVLSDVVNETTRTIKGRIEVPNRARKLKPGMFAEVVLISPVAVRALVVPRPSVRVIEGKTVVFVSRAEGVFELRPVKIGRAFEESVEILDGLEAGAVVVADGSFALKGEALKKMLEGEELSKKSFPSP